MATEPTATLKIMNHEFVELDKFDGINFNCQKDKMMFILTALNIVYVLDPDSKCCGQCNRGGKKSKIAEQKWNHEGEKTMCQDHILNTLAFS